MCAANYIQRKTVISENSAKNIFISFFPEIMMDSLAEELRSREEVRAQKEATLKRKLARKKQRSEFDS